MKPLVFALLARTRRWCSRLLRRRPAYATWRGTLRPNPRTGEQCIFFNLANGRVLRLMLPPESVIAVRETLEPGYFKSLEVCHWDESPLAPAPAPDGRSTTESP
jgi:hypothetical protein